MVIKWSPNFLLSPLAALAAPGRTVQGSDLLHASGVELASSQRHSDQTGGEGEQQSVARPVQSEREKLPVLHRVLSTPARQDKGRLLYVAHVNTNSNGFPQNI